MNNALTVNQKRILKRVSFAQRFELFKDFVTTHKRLPISLGADEETTLFRWMVNVQKGKSPASESQKKMLQTFLVENKTLPQNAIEYNF